MMNLTQAGVCYDLKNSPYSVEKMGLKFMFSTPLNRRKFIEQTDAKIKSVDNSLYRRFKFYIDARYIALIQLYMNIEHRGFAIYQDDELIASPDSIIILASFTYTKDTDGTD